MKRRHTPLLIALAAIVALSPLGSAFANTGIQSAGSSGSTGSTLAFSPVKIGLQAYFPARELFEKLGYDVSWIKESQTVSIDQKGKQLLLRSKDQYYLKDGVLKKSTQAPIQHKNRLMLPLSTTRQIFQTVTATPKGTYQFSRALKSEGSKLPRLGGRAEYDKLMSFYPQQTQIYYTMREGLETAPALPAAAEATGKDSGSSDDFSQTNNQVAGVDEADLVKTDGKYLYTLKNDQVQVFKLGRTDLGLWHSFSDPKVQPHQLFITKDYLIVIGNTVSPTLKTELAPGRIGIMPIIQDQLTSVHLYALKDIHAQKTSSIMSYAVPGHLTAARLIANNVYLITNQAHYFGPMLEPAFYRGKGKDPLQKEAISFNGMSYFPGQMANNAMYTVGINLSDLTESGIHVESYLGGGYTAYASTSALYLAGNSYGGMWWRESDHQTDLYAFDLAAGKVTFRAKGSVKGDLLNQFSMDTHEGHFRVATTVWHQDPIKGTSETTNDLYIFDSQLKPVGSLTGLAPGERIYSTRFMGDKLYMVTYRQVDPFYVIDVAVPSKPTVLGYLKIPGYSSYLHPYDDTTIIGIGMETTDLGDRVVNAGVKISLFDVKDVQNPIEKDKLIIGTGNSYTDVSWDHKAFLFSKAKNLMAMPIQAEAGNGLWTTKDAYIISFDAQGKLVLKGKISHVTTVPGQAPTEDYWEAQVNRILYVGNDLYTLSNKWLQLNDLNSLEAIKAAKR